MFDKCFEFQYKTNKIERKGESDVKVHLLTFRTSTNRVIIVNVHEHQEHSLYVIKFFDKNHRLSEVRKVRRCTFTSLSPIRSILLVLY